MKALLGFGQQFEGVGVTGSGLKGVFGDLLGDNPHIRGQGNILLGLVRRGCGEQEIHHRQNDKDGKADVQRDIQRAAFRAPPQFVKDCSRIELHSLAPGLAFALLMYPKCLYTAQPVRATCIKRGSSASRVRLNTDQYSPSRR